MPVKLSAKAIEHAPPRATRYEIADSEQPGLRLVVQPSGVKSWVYRYEREDRKSVKITLGRAGGPGALSLSEARNAANDARRLRSTGGDPADRRKAEKRAEAARIAEEEREARRKDDTIENVLGRYYADHVDHLKSGREVRRVLDKELKGWSKRRVDDIQRGDAIRLLDAVKLRAPVQSKRLRAYGRHFFAWCATKELTSINPFIGTAVVKEMPRERVLSDDELRLLLRAIDRLEWPRQQFVHLLLLTAQRLNEVGEMEWSELDLNETAPVWIMPGARVKNNTSHAVPLAPAAVEILKKMDRLADTPRVFASFSEAHAKNRIDRAMMELAREDAASRGEDPETVTIVPWRFHDLRRTAATTMPRLGVDVTVVERVLNHTMRGVMAVYQRHTFDREKRHALEVWSNFLTSLSATTATNVVPFRADIPASVG